MTPRRAMLREAHAHIAQHGRAMAMLDLSTCRTRDECLSLVAQRADTMRRDRVPGWLLAHAVRPQGWPDPAWPTAEQLDRAAGDRPCCLWSFDHHALAVNTAGLRAAGVGPGTPDPPHGRIIRDARGRATGLMLEAAAKMVWSRLPEDPPGVRLEQVAAAAADLARHGFVEVHDLLSEPWIGPVLAALFDAGRLPCRVLLHPRLEDLDEVLARRGEWERDGVRLAGAKLFADGTLNARTASMLSPYADPLPGLPRGDAMLSRERIAEALARTWSLGLTLAVHAIGDAAVRCCLDAAETTAPSRRPFATPTRPRAPRLRIEHAELIDAADVPRFARLGVVCSVQPCHLLTDIEALRRGLPHRLDRVLPLRELIDSGCRPGELLWFGSDVPIVRPHPEDSVLAATVRRRADMPPRDAVAPVQAISEAEAWAAFAPA